MGKKKWKRIAQRRSLLLAGYKGMMGYYKTELAESREGERLLTGIGRAFGETVCDLCAEVQKKSEWSAAWKASAKEYRKQTIEVNDMLLARGKAIRRLDNDRERLNIELKRAMLADCEAQARVRWLQERVGELERMMQDGVGLSAHCGEPEGGRE